MMRGSVQLVAMTIVGSRPDWLYSRRCPGSPMRVHRLPAMPASNLRPPDCFHMTNWFSSQPYQQVAKLCSPDLLFHCQDMVELVRRYLSSRNYLASSITLAPCGVLYYSSTYSCCWGYSALLEMRYMGVWCMIYAISLKGTWQDGRLRRYPTGRGEVDSCDVCTRIGEGIVGGQTW
jgi:hypothetical protein